MTYEGAIYRPPSEARSFILQATVGCSHNLCTYCAMYREKAFRVRPVDEILSDIRRAGAEYGSRVEKVFVADGDALVMPMETWRPVLAGLKEAFPRLRRVSSYAMARNVLEKSEGDLAELAEAGLGLLYLGPESGDAVTLKRIVKGGTYDDHVEAAARAHAAGMQLSVIFLLGAGGMKRSREHAQASARLATAMDPAYLSALTLTVVPGTPMAKMVDKGLMTLPDVGGVLRELRTFVGEAQPTRALFRTNHASNHLPIGGTLPQDGPQIVAAIDQALAGQIPLRPEWARGL